MARTAAVLGAAAILALGGIAALPDDEPEYLGDMPSMLEQPAPAGAAVGPRTGGRRPAASAARALAGRARAAGSGRGSAP